MLHYDVVVIGSGPAGENGAIQAAALGKKVALVEKEAVPGGACANTGTIPSKALRETALAIKQARNRDAHGIELKVSDTVTVPELMGRRGLVTAREHSRIRDGLSRAGVEYFRGTASFVDPHTIKITMPGGFSFQEVSADIALLATGTRPFHPPQYSFDNAWVYDSDSILMLDRVPRSLAILGGGVAGCEYASIFAALGVRVHVVDSKERLLPWLDAELSLAMQESFVEAGIELHQALRATKVERGDRDVLVTLSTGSRIVAEKVLVAGGRIGNVEKLNLGAAGLSATEKGILEVTPNYQTKVPHIYAAGDLVGFPGLASASMEQGRMAMMHACSEERSRLSELLPVGIYTIPEVSSVGETEESLAARSIPYVVGKASLIGNARANLIGEATGFVKILAGKGDGKILGVHCIGPHASELVHLGHAVMALGGDLNYFSRAVFNYPTLGEAFKYAAFDAQERLRAP